MKKIVLALLLMVGSVNAGDFGMIEIRDSISVADTVGGTPRADTAYSAWVNIAGAKGIDFFIKLSSLGGIYKDSAMKQDTFKVDFQHSYDKVNVHSWRLWNDSTYPTAGYDTLWFAGDVFTADDSLIGTWGRARFIHWDSMDAGADKTGLLGNVYVTRLNLYYNLFK